jgi:CDP-diacylglycerol--serine O-phosphatidyltransferase
MVLGKLRLISVADILTISNGICGILAILSLSIFYPNITIGTGLIFLGLVFDGMDGAAARKFGTKHDFGRHLDSISDSFTFCMAPGAMIIAVFYMPLEGEAFFSINAITLPINLFVILTSLIMIFFGLRRLINFTLYGYKLKNFLGLATPAMGFFVIVISHILDPHKSENNSIYIVHFSLILIILGSILMAVKIKYPKIRGKLGAVLAAAIIISLLSIEVQKWMDLNTSDNIFIYYRIVSFFGLGLIMAYVFFSPIYIIYSEKKQK